VLFAESEAWMHNFERFGCILEILRLHSDLGFLARHYRQSFNFFGLFVSAVLLVKHMRLQLPFSTTVISIAS